MNFADFDPIIDGLDGGIGSDLDLPAEPMPMDLDNDGTLESMVQGIDADGDGKIDRYTILSDIDNDGTYDTSMEGVDSDRDGQIDNWTVDADFDNDGQSDVIQLTEEIEQNNDDLLAAVGLNNGEDLPDSCQYWHQQANPDTCAIVSQEFILDELTGEDFSEDQLRQEAIDNGWYTPGGGTPAEAMGKILEAHGIPVERDTGCNLQDLTDKLAHGEKVMVAIDSDEVWHPDQIDEDDALANVSGLPGQGANHAVQVVGIDNSDPNHPMVILNDPGTPDGQGSRVPAEIFMNAWEDSNFYTVSTALHAA